MIFGEVPIVETCVYYDGDQTDIPTTTTTTTTTTGPWEKCSKLDLHGATKFPNIAKAQDLSLWIDASPRLAMRISLSSPYVS